MKIIQDIIKTKKNDINHDPQERVIHNHPEMTKSPFDNKYINREMPHSKNGIWIIAIVSIVILFFALSIFFAGATVKVAPKTYQFELDSDLTAKKEANSDELPFEIISLDGEESTVIEGNAPKNIIKKAKGKIVVYNKFSDKPQKLLINTRLLSSIGQIYKTDTAVIVPGYTLKNSEIIPGSTEVDVTADVEGKEGNVGMTDFTIPGFKGTAKYDKFFARSKTAISGGIQGLVYSISEEDDQKAKDEILATLRSKLIKQAQAQIPKDYILYENASYFISNNEPTNPASEDKNITISQKGTMYAFIFNKQKLSSAIAKLNISQYDGSDIYIPDLSSLEFNMKNTDQIKPEISSSITIHLKGNTKIIWAIDTKILAKELANKKKSEINNVLQNYKNIDKAEVTIRPFWKGTFPEKWDKINVVNTVGDNI